MQDIMPGTSWSTRPSCAMVASTFNVSTSESLGRRWPRGTETLKLRRALGRTEALVVVQITLVGERQAHVGHEFVYRGPQPECKPCKVRRACLNQDLGRRDRITRVRDGSHPSPPKRMTLHAIEAAALTLGYRVKREPFDVVAFRGLYDGKRFHMRLETHGLERVPKGSEIDLHVDFMRDVTAFHGSKAESDEIAFEMAQLLGALNAQDPERSRPRVRCPDCGKEFGQEAFRAHRKVVHGY